jgi:protein-disulfide isomerase
MLRSLFRIALFGLALGCAVPAARADETALTEAQARAVRDLVRQTLVDNPEILVEAMEALKERRSAEMAEAQRTAIREHAADLIRADDPFLGAKSAKLSAVEFFDYNCGYCRLSLPDIRAVLADNPDARVVLKDLPVLGEDSVAVSRLALAARAQGRYADFHIALLSHKGRLNEAAALDLAATLKLDTARLKKDAASKAVEEALGRNLALAEVLGISGTPTFIVGNAIFPGRIDPGTLGKALAAVRGAGK